MKAAVVGAGWAGLAAATVLRQAGCDVTVYESGHTPGGRARRVPHPPQGGFDTPLDNGQHILLGAYTDTLALMRRLGRDPDALFLRLPLCLASLDGDFRLAAPRLPAPLHAAAALLGARGLGWADRLACLRLMRGLRAAGWRAVQGETVAALLRRHGQPARAVQRLWEPLCLAALNTPLEQACAQLYANVLRDSLGGPRPATDMLLPRTDLSALWADAAAARCTMRYGHTVQAVVPARDGVQIDGERHDAAVVAVPPAIAARLLAPGPARDVVAGMDRLPHAPIATLNLKLRRPWTLPRPMMMLTEDRARGHDGQWLFDRTALSQGPGLAAGTLPGARGQRGGGPAGAGAEIAVVVSAATAIASRDRAQATQDLIRQIREQAARAGLPAMPEVDGTALLIDKRATFLAVPGMARPAQRTPWRGLALAGDWTDTGYPGVLEGAVRSGMRAAQAILAGSTG
ncbi:hydroxysqualene dehydroxylase HpnE [Bordetella bronchialis]|uniref:Amine oxidoreductase n=1 Tax=Bordetella bronchialis TaxID=463025 RepID=A0ABM6CUK1_9BORD|nr:hydroxysqualene dehydroxylase HpnE [Bordetella bronchialis]ANN67789.1 amine oxidoreductase [Bordetella bronchialis]